MGGTLHKSCVSARRLLSLSSNSLWGSLPGRWGAPNAFPRLQILRLANNYFSGALPAPWASPNAFPYMRGSRNGMCAPSLSERRCSASRHHRSQPVRHSLHTLPLARHARSCFCSACKQR